MRWKEKVLTRCNTIPKLSLNHSSLKKISKVRVAYLQYLEYDSVWSNQKKKKCVPFITKNDEREF